MYRLNVATDLDECQELWRRHMPQEYISDIWEIRACFQRHFQRPPWFVTAQDDRGIQGLMPLSWIEESKSFAFFPGETWQGKTWLEQNRILHNGNGAREAMLSQVPAPFQARYLLPWERQDSELTRIDEVGYLFHPPAYDYDFDNYLQEFSHKSAKRLLRELEAFATRGLAYRYDDAADFEILVQMNLDKFGPSSYFYDERFRNSFRDLMHFLKDQGWWRMTTVLIDGEVAAIDLGCIYRGSYTLLAGGTNAGFPGIAKLINVHHMRYACERRLRQADFLCGNFSWKTLFHLTPRPLYLLASDQAASVLASPAGVGRVADVA